MGKIDWRSVLQSRGINPEAFKTEFQENLQINDVIEDLLRLAAFQAVFHRVEICSDSEGQCSECYSGDTEFEMTHDCLDLGKIWQDTFDDMVEEIYEESEDANSESSLSETPTKTI